MLLNIADLLQWIDDLAPWKNQDRLAILPDFL